MTVVVPGPHALADVLAVRAAAAPDQRALVLADEVVTYGQLWDRVARTARRLEQFGVGPGQLVGSLMPNCVTAVAVFYAAGLLGAAVVPINVRYRRSELRHLVAHSRMSVLVVSARGRDHVDLLDLVASEFDLEALDPGGQLRLTDAPALRQVLLADSDDPGGTTPRLESPGDIRSLDIDRNSFTSAAGPDDTLMVLYTSGTTAAPKGCVVTHRAVIEGWTHWGAAAHVGEGDRIWVPCPFFHIAGIGPVIGAMIAGATVISSSHFDPDVAIAQIEREEPQLLIASFPPITFGILRHPRYDRERFGFVRVLHNVAPAETMRLIQQLAPEGTKVTNNFGMTEAAGCVTYAAPELGDEARLETTGPPFGSMQVRVADPATCRELSAGEAGEIQFRGPFTFREYLDDPGATAATIVEGGWIRSGDLGRFDDRGCLVYIGRIKEMIKVGGENVAPLEVEAHLSTHPAVQLVQVVGRPDDRYGEVPIAFVELMNGRDATADELIDHCRGQIASFKVPREVRFVTEWPMSATKIQKSKLRERLLGSERDPDGRSG